MGWLISAGGGLACSPVGGGGLVAAPNSRVGEGAVARLSAAGARGQFVTCEGYKVLSD